MGLLIRSYQFFSLQLLLLNSLSYAKHCPREQGSALIQFKQLFSFDEDSSFVCQRSYPKMISWKKDTNCCSWDGVTCDKATGNVISLDLSCSWLHGNIPSNTSLFHLLHLQALNLSHNDFDYSEISSGFSRFRNLTHFSLSDSNINGKIPYEISFLSELDSLDLSYNPLVSLETPVFRALVQNMTKLQVLSLESVEMSTVVLDSLKNLSSSLTSLSLSDCILQGNFPINIFHLPNLQMIRLSKNSSLAGDFPTTHWTSPIEYLDVSETSFSELPDLIGNLRFLRLILGYSQFVGPVPASLGNLTQLTLLHLMHNNFSGHIPSSLSNLVRLTHLDLQAIVL